MEEFNVNQKAPQSLVNVLVKHTMHHQDFWTRGFLCGDTWTVMTWSGKIEVPKSEITFWKYLPSARVVENFAHTLTKEPQTEALNKHNVSGSCEHQWVLAREVKFDSATICVKCNKLRCEHDH